MITHFYSELFATIKNTNIVAIGCCYRVVAQQLFYACLSTFGRYLC